MDAEQVIWDILAGVLPIADVPRDGDEMLIELPGADSARLVTCMDRIERHFGVSLDSARLFTVQTVGELAGLVRQELRAG
jgi:acyl carrier protein